MNREHWKAMLPAIQAFCEGKTVQARGKGRGQWLTIPSGFEPIFSDPGLELRIKPEPKLRPWKPEEVPVGAVVRLKNDPKVRSLIVGLDRDFCIALHSGLYDAPDLLERWELLDSSPCGVGVSE